MDIECIGEGSFGLIYTINKLFLYGRIWQGVAKKCRANVTSSDILREVVALSELEHPGVVTMLALWKTQRRFRTEMGFVMKREACSYSDALLSKHPFDVYKVAEQLTQAVAYIASMGYIHRDLSHRNILVDSEGNLLITDFGSAFLRSRDQREATSLTPVTTSTVEAPELIRSRFNNLVYDSEPDPYGHEIDVWAIGCLVYSAFEAPNTQGIAYLNDSFRLVDLGEIELLTKSYNTVTQRAKALLSKPMPEWLRLFFSKTLVKKERRWAANSISTELFGKHIGVPLPIGDNIQSWLDSKLASDSKLRKGDYKANISRLAKLLQSTKHVPVSDFDLEYLQEIATVKTLKLDIPETDFESSDDEE